MWLLAGHKVRVHLDVHAGATAITYRENLPLELAPLLILDAGGELAMTYHAWGEGRGNLRQLPSVTKTYRNLTTHYWDHRAGKTAHRDNEILVLAAEAALGQQNEVTVCLRDLGYEAGLTWAPTQGHLRNPKVLRELRRRGISADGPRPISPKGLVTLRRGC